MMVKYLDLEAMEREPVTLSEGVGVILFGWIFVFPYYAALIIYFYGRILSRVLLPSFNIFNKTQSRS
jgi:hypothetical protein